MGRLVRLDGLRGVLAVYVLLGHAAPMIPWPQAAKPWITAIISHGFAAVELFFALSGLVIVQSLARFKNRRLPFLRARARRILPVYWVVLAGSIIVLSLAPQFPPLPWLVQGDAGHQIWATGLPRPVLAHVAAHLTLLQGAIPHEALPYAAFSLLGPAWSLSTEFQFYLMIALFAGWAGDMGTGPGENGLTRLALGCAALALLGLIYAHLVPAGWRFGRAFLPNASVYFGLGIASVRLLRRDGGVVVFGVLLAAAVALGAASGNPLKAITPLLWLLCLLIQMHPEARVLRPASWLLGHPIVVWLGAISYPLYLVNEPVQRALAPVILRVTHGNPAGFALIWGGLAIIVPMLLAAVLHAGIERRFMQRHRQPPVGIAGAGQRLA